MTRKNSAVEILPRDRKAELQRQVAQMIEEQVSEALSHQSDRVFQPFFQTREISHEIKRRQTVGEQNKFPNAFRKYGCLSCGTKDLPHQSLWMCTKCYPRRHQQLLAIIRENEPPEEPTLRFMDTVQIARASLLAPAIPAVAEPTHEGYLPQPMVRETLVAPGRGSRSDFFTQQKAAKAAGIDGGTLSTWISTGIFEKPATKVSENRWLWTRAEVDQLKTFVEERRNAQRPAPRSPKKNGRPRLKIDVEQVLTLRSQGKSWGAIANILGCSPATVQKAVIR